MPSRKNPRIAGAFVAAALGPFLIGCGGGGGRERGNADAGVQSSDGGVDASARAAPPAAPSPPMDPHIAPCPPGFTMETSAGGVEYCEPWTGAVRPVCAGASAAIPGADACVTVGSACPTDGFPTDAPAEAIFVRPNATGTAGTRLDPLGTVAEALTRVGPGGVIALATGTHEGDVVLDTPVTLLGACAEGTALTSAAASSSAGVITMTASATGSRIENLTVGPASRPGVWASGGGELTIRDVLVSQVSGVGLWVSRGSHVDAEALVIRDTAIREVGWGINVQDGGSLALQRSALAGNLEAGLVAIAAGTTVELTDVAITETRPSSLDGQLGRGIVAVEGAEVTGLRTVLEDNTEAGILSFDEGTVVRLEQSVVRGTRPHPSGLFGQALLVDFGARIETSRVLIANNNEYAIEAGGAGSVVRLEDTLVLDTHPVAGTGEKGYGTNVLEQGRLEGERVVFEGNGQIGVFVSDVGTTASLVDVVVRDTHPNLVAGALGRGLVVQLGATVDVQRGLFEGNAQYGAFAGDPGSSLTLTDAVVRDTLGDPTAMGIGIGLGVQGAAHATVTRALFERNLGGGVYATREGTMLVLRDTIIRDTRSESDSTSGRGLVVQSGAEAEVTRVLSEGNEDVGVFLASMGTAVEISDLVVQRTVGDPGRTSGGQGLLLQDGAHVTLTRALLSHNEEVQLAAFGAGTSLNASELDVWDSLARECGPGECPDGEGGVGLGCYDRASCDVRQFAIRRAALCGAQLAFNGSLDLADGEITDCPIGVCLQVTGYDVDRLRTGVRYDNEINFDAVSLPVPSVLELQVPEG